MTMPRASRPATRGGRIPDWVQRQVRRTTCSICSAEFGHIALTKVEGEPSRIWIPRHNFDHVIPVRWCREHDYNPNVPENVLSVCHRCNLGKKGAEDALFGGNPYIFIKDLAMVGWAPYLEYAFRHYKMHLMLGILLRR